MQSGKLSGFVKHGTKEPGDLLDKGLGREESIVLLSELLDQLLLLVELFEVIGTHEGNSLGLGLIAVLLVAEHAHGELRTRHVSQPVRRERSNTIYIVLDKSAQFGASGRVCPLFKTLGEGPPRTHKGVRDYRDNGLPRSEATCDDPATQPADSQCRRIACPSGDRSS